MLFLFPGRQRISNFNIYGFVKKSCFHFNHYEKHGQEKTVPDGFVKSFVCKARKTGKCEAYFLYVEPFPVEVQRSRRTFYKAIITPDRELILYTSPARRTGRSAAISCRDLERHASSGRHKLFDFFGMALRAFGIFIL